MFLVNLRVSLIAAVKTIHSLIRTSGKNFPAALADDLSEKWKQKGLDINYFWHADDKLLGAFLFDVSCTIADLDEKFGIDSLGLPRAYRELHVVFDHFSMHRFHLWSALSSYDDNQVENLASAFEYFGMPEVAQGYKKAAKIRYAIPSPEVTEGISEAFSDFAFSENCNFILENEFEKECAFNIQSQHIGIYNFIRLKPWNFLVKS